MAGGGWGDGGWGGGWGGHQGPPGSRPRPSVQGEGQLLGNKGSPAPSPLIDGVHEPPLLPKTCPGLEAPGGSWRAHSASIHTVRTGWGHTRQCKAQIPRSGALYLHGFLA